MITKFKLYESVDEGEPKLGDYVICFEEDSGDEKFDNFLLNNIGKVIGYNSGNYDYTIKYYYAPKEYLFYFGSVGNDKLCRPMMKKEIIHWSENKEELVSFIESNKYNL